MMGIFKGKKGAAGAADFEIPVTGVPTSSRVKSWSGQFGG